MDKSLTEMLNTKIANDEGMLPPPTPEQQAIIAAANAGDESLMIQAYAGTGKTTTLTMLARALAQGGLALAFNVSARKELEKRFPPGWKVMTLNGLGHGAWMRAIPRDRKITLDERKVGRLVSAEFKRAQWAGGDESWANVRTMVSSAMLAGIVPREYPNNKGLIENSLDNWASIAEDQWLVVNDREIEIAQAVLLASVKEAFAGTISFDDQIYMPVMFNGQFQRYGTVLVDEAQDLNALQHIMVKRAAGGRLIVVGDTRQAIYQFRGADAQSMAKLRALRPNWVDLPLATTFRCPKVVVDRQQEHAPGYKASSGNKVGVFAQWFGQDYARLVGKPTWDWDLIERVRTKHSPKGSIAVLCRNNAPLLGLAFKLLRRGVGVEMLGRDIGKGLQALSKKLCPDDTMTQAECILKVTEWRDSECSLARVNGQENKIEGITDRAECLIAVLNNAATAGDLRTKLERVFAMTNGQIVLSTGHKAKGGEWDVVIHLDPDRIPSKQALRDAVQMEQERNLLYVIETRAKAVLIEAKLGDFE